MGREKVLGIQEKVKYWTRTLSRLKNKKQPFIGSLKQPDDNMSQLKRLQSKYVNRAKSDLVKIKYQYEEKKCKLFFKVIIYGCMWNI